MSRFLTSAEFQRSSLLLLLVALVLTSSILAVELILPLSEAVIRKIDPDLPPAPMQFALATTAAICVLMTGLVLFAIRIITPRLHNFIFGYLGGSHTKTTYTLAIILGFSLPFFAMLAYDSQKHTFSQLIEQYGAWLAIFALILSVVGSYFSAIAMQDLRHVINTFEDFRSRFTRMLTTIAQEKDSTNYIRIIAYTPLPGMLSLRGRGYEELRDIMLAPESRIELICLDAPSTEIWMRRFSGKRTHEGGRLQDQDIFNAIGELEELIKHIGLPHATARRRFASAHPVIRGRPEELPKFQAYFTNDRALVINALFNPIENLDSAHQPEKLSSKKIEIVGFETTDVYTLKNLSSTYELVAEQIRKRTALERASAAALPLKNPEVTESI